MSPTSVTGRTILLLVASVLLLPTSVFRLQVVEPVRARLLVAVRVVHVFTVKIAITLRQSSVQVILVSMNRPVNGKVILPCTAEMMIESTSPIARVILFQVNDLVSLIPLASAAIIIKLAVPNLSLSMEFLLIPPLRMGLG